MKIRAIVLSMITVLLAAPSGYAASPSGVPGPERTEQPDRISFHPVWQTAEIVSGRFTCEAADKNEAACDFFSNRFDLFKLVRPETELELRSLVTDDLGLTHLRFRQVYEGLPVWACETIVHFAENGDIYLVGGQTIPTPDIPTAPQVSESQAATAARSAVAEAIAGRDGQEARELIIFPVDGRARLVWLVSFISPSYRWLVFVDAQNGDIVHKFNDIRTDGPVVGSGPDVHGNMQSINTYDINGQYWMIDASRDMYMDPISQLIGTIATYITGDEFLDIIRDPDGDNVFDDNFSFRAGVSGHRYAGMTYEYYQATFNRNSFDDAGGSLHIIAHDTTEVNNAFYFGGGYMGFGSGDGIYYLPWSGALDVVAHEFTHGVTATTAGFWYQFQSGALDESFCDVFACMVDRDDWTNCEEIALWANGFLRSLENPHDGVDPDYFPFGYQPMHMGEYVYWPIENDNGAVHFNSGIPNHAGYLVATTIGREKAEQIWYRTLTTYMTPNASFYYWGEMTVQAAADLYGDPGPEVDAVYFALDSVGIGSVYPSPAYIPFFSVEIGSTADTAVYIRNGENDDIQITACSTAAGVVEVLTTFPLTVPAKDSSRIDLHVSGVGIDICNIGSIPDTVFMTTTSVNTPAIKVPVTVIFGFGSAGLETSHLHHRCGYLDFDNCGHISCFSRDSLNNIELDNGIFSASFVVGLLDGEDTVAYHNYDVNNPYRFLPVQNASGIFFTPGWYNAKRVTLATNNSQIMGRVDFCYQYCLLNFNNMGYVILDYIITNPCDTTLTVSCGLVCDFDMTDPYRNIAGYDSLAKMAYVRDEGDARAVAMVSLLGQPRAYRSLRNRTIIWPYNGLRPGDAYRELNETVSTEGTFYDDWSSLMSYSPETIGPGDTLFYQIALLFSNDGVDGLYDVLNGVMFSADTGDLFIEPRDFLFYHAEENPEPPADTHLTVTCIGGAGILYEAANSQPWLVLTPADGTTPDDLTLSYDISSLPPGDYYDTIWISSDYVRHGPMKVPVVVHVTPGDGLIRVPEDYATIQGAVDASIDGDRIVVGPGTYTTSVYFNGKSIKVTSSGGPEVTFLEQPTSSGAAANISHAEDQWTELSGFTIAGYQRWCLSIRDDARPRIANNIFTNLGNPEGDMIWMIVSDRDAFPTITGNIFHHNPNVEVCIYTTFGIITSNTFDNCNQCIRISGQRDAIITHNIMTDCLIGAPTYTNVHDYNNAWNNETDFTAHHPPGPHSLSANPQYCSPAGGNYHLAATSPCAPANNPDGVLIGARDVGCEGRCGDANTDWQVNVGDVVFIVNYVFRDGPAPDPYDNGDPNCDGIANIGDAVYIINFVFKSGEPPCCP